MNMSRHASCWWPAQPPPRVSLPHNALCATDSTERDHKKGGLALDYQSTKDLVAMLQARRYQQSNCLTARLRGIEAQDGRLSRGA